MRMLVVSVLLDVGHESIEISATIVFLRGLLLD